MVSFGLLEFENAVYVSTVLASVAFGIYITISVSVIRASFRRRSDGSKPRTFMQWYSVGMLVLVIAWFCLGAVHNSELIRGGYEEPTTLVRLLNCNGRDRGLSRAFLDSGLLWASDALLLWRTHIICAGNRWTLGALLLVYLSTIGVGTAANLGCIASQRGGSLPFSLLFLLQSSTIFYGLSVGFNTLCTIFLLIKLLRQRYRLRVVGMPTSHYTSLSSILIESAALYAVFGLIFIGFNVANNIILANVFSILFRTTAFISPALIQLRMAQGTAHPGGKIDISLHLSQSSGGSGGALRMRMPAGFSETPSFVAIDAEQRMPVMLIGPIEERGRDRSRRPSSPDSFENPSFISRWKFPDHYETDSSTVAASSLRSTKPVILD